MVSLSRTFTTNTPSSEAPGIIINQSHMDTEDLSPLMDSFSTFKPLSTVPAFSLHLVATLALELLAIVYAAKHPDEHSRCREYYDIIYAHVALWVLTFIVDQWALRRHNALRLHGYLDFYNEIRIHRKLPLYVVSLWSALLMTIQAAMEQYYPGGNFAEECLKGGALSPLGYLCGFITVEVCVLVGINVNYIVKVISFNQTQAPADAQREDWLAGTDSQRYYIGGPAPSAVPTGLTPEVGCREAGDRLYHLLQKQADLIRFLKEHNARLGAKLMMANAQAQMRRTDAPTMPSA